jgi:hypothetical protein
VSHDSNNSVILQRGGFAEGKGDRNTLVEAEADETRDGRSKQLPLDLNCFQIPAYRGSRKELICVNLSSASLTSEHEPSDNGHCEMCDHCNRVDASGDQTHGPEWLAIIPAWRRSIASSFVEDSVTGLIDSLWKSYGQKSLPSGFPEWRKRRIGFASMPLFAAISRRF